MKFYYEERVAVFIILAVLIPAALLIGYVRNPRIFLPSSRSVARDSIVVTVTGAVERPGEYRVSKGMVAGEAALMAGPRGDADLGYLDSPVALVENEVVYVPKVGEEIAERERKRENELRRVRRPIPVKRIDINTAPIDELATIPGIGDKMAEAIVLSRSVKPFRSTDEIKRVPGIGKKKYDRMREYITVHGR
ncbi:MAG: helix-hairpin-helix domain-containing protein [bacterium]